MAERMDMRVVAILRSEAAGLQLDAECSDMNGTSVEAHVGKLRDVKPGVDILQGLDALILEIDPRDKGESEALDQIVNQHFPGVPVLGTATDATVQDVRQMMRSGLVDFLPQPIAREDLIAALELAARRRKKTEPERGPRGKVVSFIKACGGVGSTTLAVQSACILADKQGADDRGVCLLDFDVQFGAAALHLDLDNRMGIADLLETPERLDFSLLETVMSRHASGLRLLAAPRDMITLDAVTTEFVKTCLSMARRNFAYCLLDLPMAWTPWSYQALEQSDLIFVVTQCTVAGVRQAKRQMQTLAAEGLGGIEVRVVMNRYEKGWGKSISLKEAEKALGAKIDHCIANDYKLVREALNQGTILKEIKRRSAVEKDIRAMIEKSIDPLTETDGRAEPRLFAATGNE